PGGRLSEGGRPPDDGLSVEGGRLPEGGRPPDGGLPPPGGRPDDGGTSPIGGTGCTTGGRGRGRGRARGRPRGGRGGGGPGGGRPARPVIPVVPPGTVPIVHAPVVADREGDQRHAEHRARVEDHGGLVLERHRQEASEYPSTLGAPYDIAPPPGIDATHHVDG